MRWLELAYYFALPVALVGFAVLAAVQGDWSAAGVCGLFGVLLMGRGLVE